MEAYRIDRFGGVEGIVRRSIDDPRLGLREGPGPMPALVSSRM